MTDKIADIYDDVPYTPIGVRMEHFEEILTKLIEKDTDEILLKKCRGLVIKGGGWGLVAELLKRFKRKIET